MPKPRLDEKARAFIRNAIRHKLFAGHLDSVPLGDRMDMARDIQDGLADYIKSLEKTLSAADAEADTAVLSIADVAIDTEQ